MDRSGHATCIIVGRRLLARVREGKSWAEEVTSSTSKTSYSLLTTSSVVGAEGGDVEFPCDKTVATAAAPKYSKNEIIKCSWAPASE